VHRPIRLGTIAGFLACSCPLDLSAPGKPSDPEIFLQIPPYYAGDATERLVAHLIFMVPIARFAIFESVYQTSGGMPVLA